MVLPECGADVAAQQHCHSASWMGTCFAHFALTSSACDRPIGPIDHTAPPVFSVARPGPRTAAVDYGFVASRLAWIGTALLSELSTTFSP